MAGFVAEVFQKKVLAGSPNECDLGRSERLRSGFRRIEEPDPRLWTGSSILLGLFHPIASTIIGLRCTVISEILNLGK